MKNYIAPGDVVEVVAGGTVASGSVQKVGQMIGVAMKGASSGETYPLLVKGAVEIPSVNSIDWDVGDLVYYVNASGLVDKTSASAKKIIGHCIQNKTTGTSDTIKIRLSGQANEDEAA